MDPDKEPPATGRITRRKNRGDSEVQEAASSNGNSQETQNIQQQINILQEIDLQSGQIRFNVSPVHPRRPVTSEDVETTLNEIKELVMKNEFDVTMKQLIQLYEFKLNNQRKEEEKFKDVLHCSEVEKKSLRKKLQDEAKSKEKVIENYQRQLCHLENENEKIKGQLVESEKLSRVKITHLENINKQLKTQNKHIQEELKAVKAELKVKEDENLNLAAKLKVKEDENRNLAEELSNNEETMKVINEMTAKKKTF